MFDTELKHISIVYIGYGICRFQSHVRQRVVITTHSLYDSLSNMLFRLRSAIESGSCRRNRQLLRPENVADIILNFRMTGSKNLRFPLLHNVVVPLLSIPNSNAECERVFSCLKKIYNSNRSEMANDSLCSLLSAKMNNSGACYECKPSKDMVHSAKQAALTA